MYWVPTKEEQDMWEVEGHAEEAIAAKIEAHRSTVHDNKQRLMALIVLILGIALMLSGAYAGSSYRPDLATGYNRCNNGCVRIGTLCGICGDPAPPPTPKNR